MGCYASSVRVSGEQNLISHNTIHDTGRDCIFVSGSGHRIEYNTVYNGGKICQNTGLLYSVNKDGGGTTIHHNWFYDNCSSGLRAGIFLDCYTANYLLHHNVIWGVGKDAIRLNRAQNFTVVANNTILGGVTTWGRPHFDDMYGVRLYNNVITGPMPRHPDVVAENNVRSARFADYRKRVFLLDKGSPGIDAGRVLPGITECDAGCRPDCGAYETGVKPWKPGHDFNKQPADEGALADIACGNRVLNSSFEARAGSKGILENRGIPHWVRTGSKAATVVVSKGGILKHPNKRRSRLGRCGVQLSGVDSDGVEQVVEGLKPNTVYTLSAWACVKGADEVRVGIWDHGGDAVMQSVKTEDWQRVALDFKTGADNTSATVFLLKPSGTGTALGDDFGVIPQVAE